MDQSDSPPEFETAALATRPRFVLVGLAAGAIAGPALASWAALASSSPNDEGVFLGFVIAFGLIVGAIVGITAGLGAVLGSHMGSARPRFAIVIGSLAPVVVWGVILTFWASGSAVAAASAALSLVIAAVIFAWMSGKTTRP